MIETSLGAQYLKAALAKWREENLWASELSWDRIPLRYRHEIEHAAMLAIAKSTAASPVEGVVGEIEHGELAA
jgi:hypothetical protein